MARCICFTNLLQSEHVKGDINLTTDGWQATNVDAYSSVTLHFVEDVSEGCWELRNGLAGFTRLNNAHNGKRLGQALFKVVLRLGIIRRVSAPI